MLMRRVALLILIGWMIGCSGQSDASGQTAKPGGNAAAISVGETPQQRDARMQWWREARFGMFVHWSHDSQIGSVISHTMVGASPAQLRPSSSTQAIAKRSATPLKGGMPRKPTAMTDQVAEAEEPLLVHAQGDTLQIEQDLDDVLLQTLDRRVLVKHTVDLDLGD